MRLKSQWSLDGSRYNIPYAHVGLIKTERFLGEGPGAEKRYGITACCMNSDDVILMAEYKDDTMREKVLGRLDTTSEVSHYKNGGRDLWYQKESVFIFPDEKEDPEEFWRD